MSNPLKIVNKVFKATIGGVLGLVSKKWRKFVGKVLPYALAAAAVVFTGGAALGVLPTFSAAVGGAVSSLGLSAGVTGALTGAITNAGFGAAIGGLMGGKKGMKSGMLMGALTGGVMGAMNPGAFGIVKGVGGQVTTMNTIAHGGNAFGAAGKGAFTPLNIGGGQFGAIAKPGTGGMAPQPAAASSALLTTAAAPVASAPVAAAPAATGGGGMLGMLGQNPMLAGQLLQGVGGALGGGNDYKDAMKAKQKMAQYAYGGVYSKDDDPFGTDGIAYAVPKPRYYYDSASGRVLDRQQPQGQG